jgi:hypothetical protein
MDVDILRDILNVVLIPIAIWLVRIEKRLTRIETILEIKNSRGKEKT